MLSVICYAQNYQSKSTLPGARLAKEDDNNEPASKKGITNVIIVYKTHFDIGYSARLQQVVHDYRTAMAAHLLDVIEKNSHQPKENQFV
jgi:alpha-mannosidase